MALTACRVSLLRAPFLSQLEHSTKTIIPVRGRRVTIHAWEKNKGGTDEDPQREPLFDRWWTGVKDFVPETKKWLKELERDLRIQPMHVAEHGNYEVMWRFDTPEAVKSWSVTTDKDNKGGYSTANFTFSKNRTGLFHGFLNKEVPKDGVLKYAGYTNITCPRPYKSFKRDDEWDWSIYNCLNIRLRGDGRTYMVVIGCNFYYDINWLNRYQAQLYTRGGPYWQTVKIPFSKFFLTHHGRIQDRQEMFPKWNVNSLGITCSDDGHGPFYLEIDSIAAMFDTNLSGKHAFELYNTKAHETLS